MMKLILFIFAIFALQVSAITDDSKVAVNLSKTSFHSEIDRISHFVMFFVPLCPHCKTLAPTWDKMAKKYNKLQNQTVAIAKVDCTIEPALCTDESVESYPTLKIFKKSKSGKIYNGGRTLQELQDYIEEILEFSLEPSMQNKDDVNAISTKNVREMQILNKEDLNLYNEEEIELKAIKSKGDSTYSIESNASPFKSDVENYKVNLPQNKMLSEDWNPDKLSKRLPVLASTSKPNINISTEKLNANASTTELDIERMTYSADYIRDLETSYQNKFTLMIAIYAATFIPLIVVIAILAWYCRKQMSYVERGRQYRSTTLSRGVFEEELNDIKKYDVGSGGGSISTAGQVSLGKLTPSTYYRRIESPSLNAISSRNGSTTISYGGKSMEAINPLENIDVFVDPKMGSQNSIADRISSHSGTIPQQIPPPPKTPKVTPYKSH